jgi:hypothetical protein
LLYIAGGVNLMKNNSKQIGEPKPAKKIKSKNRLEIKKK